MFYPQVDGFIDVFFPVFQGFAWKSKHQVDADVVDVDAAQPFDGSLYICSLVAAVKESQAMIRESLCSHAYPVYGQQLESLAEFF